MAEENINIDGEVEEQSTEVEDDTQEEDSQDDTNEEEASEEETEEEEDKELDYKTKTKERFEKLTQDLSQSKQTNEQLAQKIDLLTQTVEKLTSGNTTQEERDAGADLLEKIKKLDEEGFNSYEELAKLVSDYTKAEIEKATTAKQKSAEEKYQADVRELQTQLNELVKLGELEKSEIDSFVNWCADKLDETKTEEQPEGNIKIYGDFHRAIYHYRKHENSVKKPDPKRVERSSTPPSSSSSNSPGLKIDIKDLSNMTMEEAIRRGKKS